jgi:hypothetical protein
MLIGQAVTFIAVLPVALPIRERDVTFLPILTEDPDRSHKPVKGARPARESVLTVLILLPVFIDRGAPIKSMTCANHSGAVQEVNSPQTHQ